MTFPSDNTSGSDRPYSTLRVRVKELAHDLPLPVDNKRTPSRGHSPLSESSSALIGNLNTIVHPDTDQSGMLHAITTVMSKFWPDQFSQPALTDRLPLRFGNGVYRDAVSPDILWRNDANLPIVCYFSNMQLVKMLKLAPFYESIAGTTVSAPRLVRENPEVLSKETDHDIQFALISLAMAQSHFYTDDSFRSKPTPGEENWRLFAKNPQQPEFRDIDVRILTVDVDQEHFIVYRAGVTAKMLESFHDSQGGQPHENEAEGALCIIEERVKIWPLLGFRERLGKAFGKGIVGTVDDKNLETWKDDVPKRKASDVSNGDPKERLDTTGKPIGKKRPRID